MFSVYLRIPLTTTTTEVTAAVIAVMHALLAVVGFGLIFSYNKRLLWSGLGFNLLIVAIVIQFYPLMNAFWSRTRLYNATDEFRGGKDFFRIHSGTDETEFNTLTMAFRCAISMCVAFSFVLGRAGAIEALLMTIIGVIGFDLTRLTIDNYTEDNFGTSFIFAYGAFIGLTTSLMLYFAKEKKKNLTGHHRYNTANDFSAAYALAGSLVIFVMAPITLVGETRVANGTTNTFIITTSALSLWLTMAMSSLTAVGMSLMFAPGTGINARVLLYGPLAGAIAGGSSSIYVSNPGVSLGIGFFSGVILAAGTTLERHFVLKKKSSVIATSSTVLFVGQSIVGFCTSAVSNAIVR